MSLFISHDAITGEHTTHTARPVPGDPHAWEVTWLPGRRMNRNNAITAMVLADVAGSCDLESGDRLWPHVQGWAAEVGLTASQALARVSQPSARRTAGRDGAAHSDPEAAG